MKEKFPCIECGLCCYKVNEVPEVKYLYDVEKDCCRYLNCNTYKCTIYNNRPAFCNVEHMYDEYFSHTMSESEFILINLKVCYQLNKEKGFIANCQKLAIFIDELEIY
ncbi:YkgJ family cysteine cluster protein [Veillonella agrestimuris]|uniref:YkgJ family cysteine cluster protein n=1 Tax=Veillonella agrestimuris TaxID=2941340 RepID=UPI002040E64C|nr:YkgJ family cysteine cluster protein [Veillonella agrestimuris]